MNTDEYTVTFTGNLRRLGRFAANLERLAAQLPDEDARSDLLQVLEACVHDAGRVRLHVPSHQGRSMAETLVSLALAWDLYASIEPTSADEAQRDQMVPLLLFSRGGFPDRAIVAPSGQDLDRLFMQHGQSFRPEKPISEQEHKDGYVVCDDGALMGMLWAERTVPIKTPRTLYEAAKTRAIQAGFEVRPDPDQPGMYLFVDPHGNGSDISFPSVDEAWNRIVAELPSYDEVERENAVARPEPHEHPRFAQVEAYFLARFDEDMDGAANATEGVHDAARRAAFFVCQSEESVRAVLDELRDAEASTPPQPKAVPRP